MNYHRPLPLRSEAGHPWYMFCVAAGIAVLLSVAFALAVRSATKPVAVAPVQHSDAPAKRGDRLPLVVATVRTIPIVQPAPEPRPLPSTSPPVVEAAAAGEPKEVRPRQRDICERHGRRKVWVTRYRWRCLK